MFKSISSEINQLGGTIYMDGKKEISNEVNFMLLQQESKAKKYIKWLIFPLFLEDGEFVFFFFFSKEEREVISAKVICWCKCNLLTNSVQGHIGIRQSVCELKVNIPQGWKKCSKSKWRVSKNFSLSVMCLVSTYVLSYAVSQLLFFHLLVFTHLNESASDESYEL